MRPRLWVAALLLSAVSTSAQAAQQYKGQSLIDALRALQAQGLRIVFSSATVTEDLRVQIEPRSTRARRQLDELLAPHGLVARDGPGGTIEVIRAGKAKMPDAPAFGRIEGQVIDAVSAVGLRSVAIRIDGEKRDTRTDEAGRFLLRRVTAGSKHLVAIAEGYISGTQAVAVVAGGTATVTLNLFPVSGAHSEYISVTRRVPHRKDQGVASEMNLDRSEWAQSAGSLSDDPVRAVHVFPGVAAVDDFRSEFTVRGSSFRHVDLVIDGVSTQWLQHTAYGRGATGSLPMLAGDVLEDATLRAGAYPRRYGDRLGAQLDLTVREGSRARFMLRGAVSGTNLALTAEGPLGSSDRGSWLVAARQSYAEWPFERAESARTAFGFFDGLAKLVYDIRPRQQITMSVLGGTSSIDGDDNPIPNGLGSGRNRAAVANISWRSSFGSAVVLHQRAYVLRHRSINEGLTGLAGDRASSGEVVYRGDVSRVFGRGVLEGGGQAGRMTINDLAYGAARSVSASSVTRSAYAHATWAVMPSLTLSSGVRVSASSLLADRAGSRWLLGEWVFRPGWSVNVSSGVSQQLPELSYVRGTAESVKLRPERANFIDVGIEQRLTNSMRWQATVFSRRERDILRDPDIHPRVIGGLLVFPDRESYVNALGGKSRGIELVVDRRRPSGLSGWVSYSYGKTRYSDGERRETYWGNFDQRHSVNLFATYRLSSRTGVGATFRAGSNFPIPAYLTSRDDGFFMASVRNQVRLPPYARLDLRADRHFDYFGRRVVLVVELLNALNRANMSLSNGSVDLASGQAIGFTDALFRRRVSAGLIIDF